MTSRYESIPCPICGKPLDTAEVVVCPICGAPYHKECFSTVGECQFYTLHENGEDWQPPKTKEEIVDGNAALRCSRCGTINPATGLFCQVCGNQLNNMNAEQNSFENSQQGGFPPQQGMYPPTMQMPLNPYTTPFGGVAPDEEIDGIPAKDLAIFVGRNSHYYLPRFKDQVTTKSKTINWASFIFTGGHFIYRKMYIPGILTILLEFALSIPYFIMMYNTLSVGMSTGFTTAPMQQTNETLLTLNMVCNFLTMGLRFVCGIFGNVIYRKHCYKKIQKIKATATSTAMSQEEYVQTLAKKGSVAIKLITGILIAYTLVYMVSMFAIMLM